MIKNGLYKISTEFLDGADISNVHVMVLHDGKLPVVVHSFTRSEATPAPPGSGKVKRLLKSIRAFLESIRGQERSSPWDLWEPTAMRALKSTRCACRQAKRPVQIDFAVAGGGGLTHG
jgi:hypothetical protein